MNHDIIDFSLQTGVINYLIILSITLAVVLGLCLVLSFLKMGPKGIGRVFQNLGNAAKDLASTSCGRIWAIASLTTKETIRKRVLLVLVIFGLLFMFAGWFLGDSNERADLQVKVHISFVLTVISWMTLILSVLIACWGLPGDIKAKSIHTVVTKPVRRHEIVMGRIGGYIFTLTVILLLMGSVSYIWTTRAVSEEAQSELICRVPHYGKLDFSGQFGGRVAEPEQKKVNVGDIWDFRSYIEGGTLARTWWSFEGINVSKLRQQEAMSIEYNFEAFRAHKGDLESRLRCQMTLINPESGLRAPLRPFEVVEYSNRSADKTVLIPETFTYREEGTGAEKSVNLFDDLITADGRFEVEVKCLDPGQFLGMARPDLFIRMPDKTFFSGFAKAIFGIWLLMCLVIIFSVTASTFTKGPVATLLVVGLLMVGATGLRELMVQLIQGTADGGGPLEASVRMWTHMAPTVKLDPTLFNRIMMGSDQVIIALLSAASYIIPPLETFNMSSYVANGFDVPWSATLLPSLCIVIGYIIPALLLAYFAMRLREMEAK